jgi:hypothetical protein
MSIEIERIETDRDQWNRCVQQSPQATLLHKFEALDVQATYSNTTLHALLGRKGQEPVGLFPVFEVSKGPVTAALSPPPTLWVQKLGPAFLNMAKLKQRKAERRRRRFIEGVLEWIEAELNPRLLRFHAPEGVEDTRPFKWSDCDVTPKFTYVTDLRPGADALLEQFSSDARRNIRKYSDEAFTIEVGDGDDTVRIMEQVQNRYDAQDEPFGVPAEFPRALWRALPDGQIRPYVFRIDGEFYGGIIATDDGETLARLYGGVTPDDDVDLPINDLLDWHIMKDGIERGHFRYDFVGAGDQRLNAYKAKFAPQLRTFYGAERTSLPMKYLLQVYRGLPKL